MPPCLLWQFLSLSAGPSSSSPTRNGQFLAGESAEGSKPALQMLELANTALDATRASKIQQQYTPLEISIPLAFYISWPFWLSSKAEFENVTFGLQFPDFPALGHSDIDIF